jgi:hypothetical protein
MVVCLVNSPRERKQGDVETALQLAQDVISPTCDTAVRRIGEALTQKKNPASHSEENPVVIDLTAGRSQSLFVVASVQQSAANLLHAKPASYP